MADTPNPGSEAAQQQGCVCPVMDNCRGKWPPYPPTVDYPEGAWYINLDCPLHSMSGPESP